MKEEDEYESDFFSNLRFRKIVSPFAELHLLDELIVVSYGLILSVYDMRSGKWRKHASFDRVGDRHPSFGIHANFGRKEIKHIFRTSQDEEDDFY